MLTKLRSGVVDQLEPCSEWENKSRPVKFIFAKIDSEMLLRLSDCVSRAVELLHVGSFLLSKYVPVTFHLGTFGRGKCTLKHAARAFASRT